MTAYIVLAVIAYLAIGVIVIGALNNPAGLKDDEPALVFGALLWPLVLVLVIGYRLFTFGKSLTK